MSKEEHVPSADNLADAVLNLKTKEECLNFLSDLCTIQEIKSMEQRMQVAKMLNRHVTYAHISDMTGASTATISRVNRALLYGENGYKTVLERLEANEEKED